MDSESCFQAGLEEYRQKIGNPNATMRDYILSIGYSYDIDATDNDRIAGGFHRLFNK